MPSFALFLLALCVGSLAETIYDNSHRCVQLYKQPRAKKRCNVPGSVKAPQVVNSYSAYDAQECAQRCFGRIPHCRSFSFDISTTTTNCLLFSKNLTRMGFVRDSSSSVKFYASSCSFHYKIDDTPVQDGDFSESANTQTDWQIGHYHGYNGRSGKARAGPKHYEFGSDPSDASIYGFQGFSIGPAESAYVTSGGAYIEQVLSTCPGMTYSLTLSNTANADLSSSSPVTFDIFVNDETLYTQTFTTATTNEQEPGGPFYFTVARSSATLRFAIPVPTDDRSVAILTEDIDDVVVQSVYRGALPDGTKVVEA